MRVAPRPSSALPHGAPCRHASRGAPASTARAASGAQRPRGAQRCGAIKRVDASAPAQPADLWVALSYIARRWKRAGKERTTVWLAPHAFPRLHASLRARVGPRVRDDSAVYLLPTRLAPGPWQCPSGARAGTEGRPSGARAASKQRSGTRESGDMLWNLFQRHLQRTNLPALQSIGQIPRKTSATSQETAEFGREFDRWEFPRGMSWAPAKSSPPKYCDADTMSRTRKPPTNLRQRVRARRQ